MKRPITYQVLPEAADDWRRGIVGPPGRGFVRVRQSVPAAIAIIVGTIVLVVVCLGVGWVIGGIGDGSVR